MTERSNPWPTSTFLARTRTMLPQTSIVIPIPKKNHATPPSAHPVGGIPNQRYVKTSSFREQLSLSGKQAESLQICANEEKFAKQN